MTDEGEHHESLFGLSYNTKLIALNVKMTFSYYQRRHSDRKEILFCYIQNCNYWMLGMTISSFWGYSTFVCLVRHHYLILAGKWRREL